MRNTNRLYCNSFVPNSNFYKNSTDNQYRFESLTFRNNMLCISVICSVSRKLAVYMACNYDMI